MGRKTTVYPIARTLHTSGRGVTMTIEQRIAYNCVHADEDWLLRVVIEIAMGGKLEPEESRNLLESLLPEE
jgi:hypothetical protein